MLSAEPHCNHRYIVALFVTGIESGGIGDFFREFLKVGLFIHLPVKPFFVQLCTVACHNYHIPASYRKRSPVVDRLILYSYRQALTAYGDKAVSALDISVGTACLV